MAKWPRCAYSSCGLQVHVSYVVVSRTACWSYLSFPYTETNPAACGMWGLAGWLSFVTQNCDSGTTPSQCSHHTLKIGCSEYICATTESVIV